MDPSSFATSVMAYCSAMTASVTSWGRTGLHNHQVGGVEGSFHVVWLAADVVYDEPPPVEYRRMAALRLGLKLVVEEDHDHLQPF